jgi:pimeloyl-ACP methyl ester carboxylesterase
MYWVSRATLLLLALIVIFAMAGVAYQAIMERVDAQRYPPPGKLVDVGGLKLHIHCIGESKPGAPTVILETLAGGTSLGWAWVQPEIARSTRVCAYDRAGRGWSEPIPDARNASQVVDDLHRLLANGGVPGPYILVGHSLGGIYARLFAAAYPDEVAGMVLLDSAHPEQLARYPEWGAASAAYERQLAYFPWLARLGLFRLFFAAGGEIDFASLPPAQRAALKAFWSSPHYFVSQAQEMRTASEIYERAESPEGLGALPLIVVSAPEGQPQGWADLQKELVALSSNSTHRIVDGATHVSLTFDPQHAGATSAAVLEIVEIARTGQPLAR